MSRKGIKTVKVTEDMMSALYAIIGNIIMDGIVRKYWIREIRGWKDS